MPMTMHSGTVTTTSPIVLTSNSPTRGRTTSSYTRDGPVEITDQAT